MRVIITLIIYLMTMHSGLSQQGPNVRIKLGSVINNYKEAYGVVTGISYSYSLELNKPFYLSPFNRI